MVISHLGDHAWWPGRLEEGGWRERDMGKPVTFTEAYHVMVRNWPNTCHENVSLDFSYTLC